jgi:outer membrane cobalamin receptor
MWRFFLPAGRDISPGQVIRIDSAKYRPECKRQNRILVLAWLFALLIFALPAQAQLNTSLKGHVYDGENGRPVSGAAVKLSGTGYHTVTDDFGRFGFDNLPPGIYTLSVSAPGYDEFSGDDIQIISDVTRRVNVRLSRRVYYLGRITVRGQRTPVSSDKVEVIFREEIEKTKARDLPELLEKVRGLHIQKTGTAAGKSTVRVRGSAPEHVLVLLDGQKINPSGSGVADLRTIPLGMIERVEIHKGGGSAEFGPDALGGVINIITQQRVITDRLSVDAARAWGKWKREAYSLAIRNPIPLNNLSSKLAYDRKESVGDFDYAYEVHPNPETYRGTRANNFVDAYSYFTSGIYRCNDRLKLLYSGQYYHSYNGLPGRAINQNMSATSGDRRKLINAGLHYEKSDNHIIETNLSFSRYEQDFIDRQSAMPFDSRYTNDIFTVRHVQQCLILTGNQIRFGTEWRRDILYHTDVMRPKWSMGKTTRDDIGLFISDEQRFNVSALTIADEMVLDGSLRYDWIDTRKDSTSVFDTTKSSGVENLAPKIGAAISKGDRYSYILRASYGKSVSLPTMNALFWVGDARSSGNPGLKPEESEHSEAGFELRGTLGPMRLSGGVTYFHSHVTNLIVWRPSAGVWRPVNMERAQITGHEDFVEMSLFDKSFSLTYQNTVTTSLNKSPGHTVYNKRLVFSPHFITSLSAALDYRFLYVSYSLRWVDSAYTTIANTKYYDGYRIHDLHLGLRLEIARKWQISTDYKLYNVWDKSYVLMAHYPMPGREWNFDFKITYEPGRGQ